MGTTDHSVWTGYKAALERLARAGVRMEAARAMHAPDLAEAEEAFRVATGAYDAAREQLTRPTPSRSDHVLVLRAWLRQTELALWAASPRDSDRDAEQT